MFQFSEEDMKICFELSMPSVGSWNGKWSGEGNLYAKVLSFSNSKAGSVVAQRILNNGPYYYNWGDGWGAEISVREVKGSETAKIKRKSKGFCGYDWMIDNIRFYGSIYKPKV